VIRTLAAFAVGIVIGVVAALWTVFRYEEDVREEPQEGVQADPYLWRLAAGVGTLFAPGGNIRPRHVTCAMCEAGWVCECPMSWPGPLPEGLGRLS
jgi:hypothetical protein